MNRIKIDYKKIVLKQLEPKDVSMVYVKWLNDPEVNKFLECFIKKFDIKELYINFHPHQSETTREIIIKKLKSLCNNLIIIPDNIMIEKLLMNNTLINIYGIGTSLLILFLQALALPSKEIPIPGKRSIYPRISMQSGMHL